ncbi:MAG TPA: hypothetical protein VJA21_23385 [Verrucomicrobiae bacterium]
MKNAPALLLLIVLIIPVATFGQGSLTPSGPPGPTMKSLQDIWDRLAGLSVAQKFTGFTNAHASAAGGLGSELIPIAAGRTVKLESISVTTYADPSPIVYLKYLVKISSNSSRIMIQHIPLGQTTSYPLANTRSGTLLFPLWVSGGDVFDVAVGEAHSLEVRVQSSASATAQSSWVLTGSYGTP